MNRVVRTEKSSGTWLDKVAHTTTYYLTNPSYNYNGYMNSDTGLRVYVMRWDETKDVEITLHSGDGRAVEFQKYKEEKLKNPSEKKIEKIVQEMVEFAYENILK